MELQVGVKVLLQNTEGRYLLLKRSPATYPDVTEPWDIVGGRIDPGASLLENLRREVKEEAGFVLEGEPRLIAAQDILKTPGRHVVRLTYIGSAEGEPQLNEEHDDFRWFSLKEMEELEGLDGYVKEVLAQGYVK